MLLIVMNLGTIFAWIILSIEYIFEQIKWSEVILLVKVKNEMMCGLYWRKKMNFLDL